MIAFDYYRSGDVFGIRYRLTDKGDVLPAHVHDSQTLHNIIVLSGRVRFRSDLETRELCAGDVFDFDGSQVHCIECVEPGSQILNLLLHGCPTAYANLTESDLKGVIAP